MPSLTTVLASKDQYPTSFPTLLLATFGPFSDGSNLYLSSSPLGTTEGGTSFGVAYGGHDYLGRLGQQDIAQIQALSAQSITLIPTVTLTIADPDSNIYLSWEQAAGRGFKGTPVVLDLVMYDPIGKTFSSDAIRKYYGTCELPKRTRRGLTVASTSLKNPQRDQLPSLHIQRRCNWTFPTTAHERQEAADNRSAPGWECGYSPDASGPNAVGNLVGGVPAVTCNRTKADCLIRGMYESDSNARLTRRFGGFQWNGPSQFKGKSFFSGKDVTGYNFSNQARFNDLVPLAYGTTWVDCLELQPLGAADSTRFEAIVCYGEVGGAGIRKVIANDVELTFENPADKLFLWRYVTAGYRQGRPNTDLVFDGKGDPYGSTCVIEIVIPTALGQSTQVGHVRALVNGPLIVRPTSTDTTNATVASWPRESTTNPVWILLDLMTWANYQYSEIDIASWMTAAAFCNTQIQYTDQNGILQPVARYIASFSLRQRRSASDVIQGLLNSFGGILVPNNNGNLLQLFIRQTLADQQPAAVPGSNYNVPIASTDATGAPSTGYAAYRFDESNIIAETLETEPLPSSETGNRLTITFQDKDNGWAQDSVSTMDSSSLSRSGNQELPISYPVDGISTFDQANRVINTRMAQLFRGNPRGDAGGTVRYRFDAAAGALHLRIGQLVVLSWLQDGLVNQLFRVESVRYAKDARTISLLISWHSDGWYQDNYGTFADPFYSDPRKTLPLRPPYAWEPNGVVATGNLMYGAKHYSFGLTPSYEVLADGTSQTKLSISGVPPVNQFGKADPPNVPLDGLKSNSGGSLPSGEYKIGFSSYDSDGNISAVSKLVGVHIPGGTATNTITVNNIYWPPNATDGAYFIAGTEWDLAGDLTLAGGRSSLGTPSTVTIAALPAHITGPPDVKFDHFHVRSKRVIHAGIIGAALSAVGSAVIGGDPRPQGTASIAGFGASTTDQFKNYNLSLLGFATPGATLPLLTVTITASSSDVNGNLNLVLSSILTPTVSVGDIVVIRALPTVITTNSIGDPNFMNSLYPSGIPVDGSEVNSTLGIIAGTGAGQWKTIVSNAATSYTIDGTWDITPDLTSVFIVVEPSWQIFTPTETIVNKIAWTATPQHICDVYVDNRAGQTYLVQVLTEDINDSSGPDNYAPFREIYIPGSAGLITQNGPIAYAWKG